MTTPDRIAEIELRLTEWRDTYKALMPQLHALCDLTGGDMGSPLLTPVIDLWETYTDAVAALVGDRGQWLQWYEVECEMGKTPMRVESWGGRAMNVRTLRQLARLIAQE